MYLFCRRKAYIIFHSLKPCKEVSLSDATYAVIQIMLSTSLVITLWETGSK
jgi:hypothetical protein